MYEYRAVITNVVDGDTFDLDIDVGFYIHVNVRVRLLDIDCPEKTIRNGEEEKTAGLFVTDWANKYLMNKNVKITSYKGTDSFGRWLVDMKVDFDNNKEYKNLKPIYDMNGFNKKNENYDLKRLLEYANEK